MALFAGPTASGKSAAALALAEAEGGTIINADASQVYRDLRILTARPTAAEEARVPHRLYGHRDADEACSAESWAAEARMAIADCVAEGRLPILVGGTGLYIRTILEGIAPVPAIPADARAEVRAMATAAAYAALAREDPRMAARLHRNDTARIQRALEVVRATGCSLIDWRATREGGIASTFAVEVIRVDRDVEALCARCDARVDGMIADGAIDEVAALLDRGLSPDLPAMRAIGVRSIGAFIDGKQSLAEAVEQIQHATRQYAKRQRTWFRNQVIAAGA